ncbi:MAG: ParB/RepB/Spo0J family partition protein [Gammaproteobacteria bacterium]
MMVKKRGLGKSLNALLAYKATPAETTENEVSTSYEQLCDLPVDRIQRGKYQPRREMDAESLEELASSIRAQGIIQPLIVRPFGDKYEIIAGERRWRAAQMAGMTDVPVIIRDIPDEAAVAIALIENIQRENLNPIEEAIALQRLLEEFEMTHQQVAEAVGKSRAAVSNLLRLLGLPQDIRNLLERGMIEMGHARTLITLPANLQLKAAEMIVARGLSVRETENLVKQLQAGDSKQPQKPVDPDIVKLQENLTRQLKLKVAIQCNAKGKGKLVIHYRNLDELDRLLEQLDDNVGAV